MTETVTLAIWELYLIDLVGAVVFIGMGVYFGPMLRRIFKR